MQIPQVPNVLSGFPYVGVMVSIRIPMKRFLMDRTSDIERALFRFDMVLMDRATHLKRDSADHKLSVCLSVCLSVGTFAVLFHRFVEEPGDSVRGNGEGDSRRHLQGVNPDDLAVLQNKSPPKKTDRNKQRSE